MRIGVPTKIIFILTATVVSASSQIRLSPGVIVGTPLTGTSISSSSSSINGVDSSYENFHSVTKRLLIGPSLNLELSHGLGFELDALYQRMDSDSANASTSGSSYSYQSFAQTTANRWQFPFLLQYRHGIGKSSAFVEGGPSISTIAGARTTGSSTTLSPPSAPSTSMYTATSSAATTAGITAGAGITIPLAGHHLRAELRFSHWFANATDYPTAVEISGSFAPGLYPVTDVTALAPISGGSSEHTNEASLLLGFSF